MTIEQIESTHNDKPDDSSAVPVAARVDYKGIVDKAVEVRKAATGEALLFNYVLCNGAPKDRHVPSIHKVLETAVRFGHESWPLQIKNLALRRDVLHVGCGATLHGPVFRALGATTYTGLDRLLAPTKKRFRSRIEKKTLPADFSLVDVMQLIPGISYMQTDEIVFREAFDLAVMQTGTHTAPSVQSLFAQLHRALRPKGEIWFAHENFYCWSGHQAAPRSPAAYDAADADQQAMVDWGHLSYQAPEGHRLGVFNRLTPTELRKITDTYFEVTQWNLIAEKSDIKERLTPEKRKQLAAYSEIDLTTKQIVCRAVKRDIF